VAQGCAKVTAKLNKTGIHLLTRSFISTLVFALSAIPTLAVESDADDQNTQAIIQKYLERTSAQEAQLRGLHMDMDIDASLPKLEKTGKLHALRQISRVGQVTYQGLKFIGDNTIKNDVILRYLRAETDAQTGSQHIGITPENYKFKYKGVQERDGRMLHVFNLTPRKNRTGLFKGELWLDPDTCLPIREQGRFVKNPSVFLKKVEFVREYEIRNGVAFPKHIESTVDTRFWGKAEMTINFSNISKEDEQPQAVLVDTTAQTAAP
jgi:hypothetical protein